MKMKSVLQTHYYFFGEARTRRDNDENFLSQRYLVLSHFRLTHFAHSKASISVHKDLPLNIIWENASKERVHKNIHSSICDS